jgi:hypothetical protein
MKKNRTGTTAMTAEDIRILRSALLRFGADHEREKVSWLTTLSEKPLRSARVIMAYHDALLLAEAYAGSKEVHALARTGLESLAGLTAQWWQGKDERKKYWLSGSGIANTPLIGSFSFELVRWLSAEVPDVVTLEGQGESETAFQDLYARALHPLEFHHLEQKDMRLDDWLKAARPGQNALSTLLRLTDALPVFPELRELLFDSQKVYIQTQLDGRKMNRTFSRFVVGPTHYQQEIRREVDLISETGKQLPRAITLSEEEKAGLVAQARIALFNLFRETDPVTFADIPQTELISVGRGVTIALFSLRPERRLPLDSYVGYMAYKNGIPQAYGGAWIFRRQAKIGINIFPAFRGGESAWLFAQLLRVYSQRYAVVQFAVEPYQIGKNNPEGIQSGAFWFYYRLGFRPVQPELAEIAGREYAKIRETRAYQSGHAILKKLANSDLLLRLQNCPQLPFTATYSRLAGEMIRRQWNGDEVQAAREAHRICARSGLRGEGSKDEAVRRSRATLELLAASVLLDKQPLSSSELSSLERWLRSRYSVSEAEWQRVSNRCDGFFRRVDRLSAKMDKK